MVTVGTAGKHNFVLLTMAYIFWVEITFIFHVICSSWRCSWYIVFSRLLSLQEVEDWMTLLSSYCCGPYFCSLKQLSIDFVQNDFKVLSKSFFRLPPSIQYTTLGYFFDHQWKHEKKKWANTETKKYTIIPYVRYAFLCRENSRYIIVLCLWYGASFMDRSPSKCCHLQAIQHSVFTIFLSIIPI